MVGRFIQQDFGWRLCQRAGNMHPLTLAAGQAQPALLAAVQHIDTLQSRGDGVVILRAPVRKGSGAEYVQV